MKFKFSVDDIVKLEDGRRGKILKILYDSDSGVRYQVEMNSIDFVTNEIVPGHITLPEDQLEKYEKK